MIRRGFRVLLPAIAAVALLAPGAAQAAAPTGLTVTPGPYSLQADWGLPAGMESQLIEVSENQDLSSPFIADPLSPNEITYSTSVVPGVVYVRVAAVPAGCPTCAREYSEIVQSQIPPARPAPVLTSVGHAGRYPTATWTLGAGTVNYYIEAATSPAMSSDGFDDWVWVDFQLDPTQTTYTSPEQLDPGFYYVHVAAYDSSCPIDLLCPDLFSNILTVTIPPDPQPVPQAQSQPPPPLPAPPADKVTSFATLKCASTQKAGTLVVQAAMPENGTITVGGTVSVPNASKVFKLKRVTVNAIAGKTVKIKVKLPGKALKATRKALKRHRKVKASLTVTAKDGAGNSRSEKRSVKLK